jgi:hypothetical protein
MSEKSDLSALKALNEVEAKQREGRPEALRMFEEGCNMIALTFPHNSAQRRIAITARGDMREACGEART